MKTSPPLRQPAPISRIARLPLFICAFVALGAGQPAVAAGEVYVRLLGIGFPYPPAITGASGNVSGTFNSTQGFFAFRNYAAASVGGLVISARESVSGPGGDYTYHSPARTDARWQEDITINSPGRTGQAGTMTITYRVNGYLLFTGTTDQTPGYNRAFLTNTVTIDGNEADFVRYERTHLGVTWGHDFMNADRTIQWGFTFGTPFSIRHSLRAETAIDARWNAGARSEVEAAGVWKGITVTHQSAPVTNFTATSVTVPEWSLPLPRPVSEIASTMQAGDMVFTWPEQAGCDLLTSPDYNTWNVSTAPATVSGMFKTVRVPMTARRAFFKLFGTP